MSQLHHFQDITTFTTYLAALEVLQFQYESSRN